MPAQVIVVRSAEVGHVWSACVRCSSYLVPWVVVASKGNMLRTVEFPPHFLFIGITHVHTLVQKLIQLIGHRLRA